VKIIVKRKAPNSPDRKTGVAKEKKMKEMRAIAEKGKQRSIIGKVFLPQEERGKVVFFQGGEKEEVKTIPMGSVLILKEYEDKGRFIICRKFEKFAGPSDQQLISLFKMRKNFFSSSEIWKGFVRQIADKFPLPQAINMLVEVPLEALERGIKHKNSLLLKGVEEQERNLRDSGDVISIALLRLIDEARKIFQDNEEDDKERIKKSESFKGLSCWIDQLQQHPGSYPVMTVESALSNNGFRWVAVVG